MDPALLLEEKRSPATPYRAGLCDFSGGYPPTKQVREFVSLPLATLALRLNS